MAGKECVLYWFSGTGNARHTAEWVGRRGEAAGFLVTSVNLGELENRRTVEIPDGAMIGIIGPTHGFNFPPLVFHFILRLPRSRNNSVFIMNTRAGTKLGPIFFPGLSGLAQPLTALVLRLKGYRVVGMKPVDLPSNWISVHPALFDSAVRAIYARRKLEVEAFADVIFSGGRNYRALFDIVQDLVISPIALLYYLFGRFFLAKTFYASADCTMCGICVKNCPVQAIDEVAGHPYWTWKCESCMKCMNQCPERAIETAHGFAFLMMYLAYALIIDRIYEAVNIPEIVARYGGGVASGLASLTVETVVCFPFLFAGYRLMHYGLRFRIFERIMVWSSLTHFFWWRRYRVPRDVIKK